MFARKKEPFSSHIQKADTQFHNEVLPAEKDDIQTRRNHLFPDLENPGTVISGLTGMCLSGGGIRSATFNLGLMQALHRCGILPLVDYLSTVSGGGYLGSCLDSYLSAGEKRADLKDKM